MKSKRLVWFLCALLVGVMDLPVGLAMANGWNPYDFAPGLQRIEAGVSCLAGVGGLVVACAVGLDSILAWFLKRRNHDK